MPAAQRTQRSAALPVGRVRAPNTRPGRDGGAHEEKDAAALPTDAVVAALSVVGRA